MGTGKGAGKSMHKLCGNYPLADLEVAKRTKYPERQKLTNWAGSSIFFIFPPFLREGGGGVRGEGGIPLKSEEKGGQKGGGRGGVDAGKGSGHFLGRGVLNIYFEG